MTIRRICTICARGGSKGVPGKNIRPLFGRPLIAYSIQQALRSGLFEHIAVSSDSAEILEISGKWGADILVQRPDELAQDRSPKVPAIRHCVMEAEKMTGTIFNTCVDLDASSPLRISEDIENAVHLLEEKCAMNVITGSAAHRSPYFNLVELDEHGVARLAKTVAVPVASRQEAPKCFDMNASIYVWEREILISRASLFNEQTLFYEMPFERSWDIDSEIDFEIVQLLAGKQPDFCRS